MASAVAATTDQALNAVFGIQENGVFSGSQPRAKEAHVKYWVTREGWIGLGPDIHTDAPKYQQYVSVKGWKELPDRFGREQEYIRNATMRPGRKQVGLEHVWLQRFFENGGLTYICQPNDPFGRPGEYLMPKEQLVSLNLHRLPEIRNLRPDLEDAVDVECPYGCMDEKTRTPRMFAGVNEEEARKSMGQHVLAVHQDTVATRAMAQEIGKVVQQSNAGGVNPELIAQIAAAVAAVMKNGGEMPKSLKPKQEPRMAVKPPLAATMPEPSWTRQQLMSWAGQNGIPRPERPMALNRDQWYEHIVAHLPTSSPEDSGLQE